MNWVIGPNDSGKSTLLELVRHFREYVYKKEIQTDLKVSGDSILYVDTEFCRCSDPKLEQMFSMFRGSSGRKAARLRFFQALEEEISERNRWEILLIDDPLCHLDENDIATVVGRMESMAATVTVVATATDGLVQVKKAPGINVVTLGGE